MVADFLEMDGWDVVSTAMAYNFKHVRVLIRPYAPNPAWQASRRWADMRSIMSKSYGEPSAPTGPPRMRKKRS
jgi:hypothetical protein